MDFEDEPVPIDPLDPSGLMINYGRIGTFDFRCRFDPFAEATPGRDLTINYDHGSNYTNDLEVGDDAASWDGTAKILFFTNENFDEEINQSGIEINALMKFISYFKFKSNFLRIRRAV